jgi:hypothetical protein
MWKETRFWVCDICGKEFYPDSAGYKCYYELNLKGNDDFASVRDIKEAQVCCRCAEKINNVISDLRE